MQIISIIAFWAAVILVSLVSILLLSFFLFLAYCSYYLERLQFHLPWLKWLTLDEVVATGFSRWMCEMLLPILHRHGQLEIRPRGDVVIESGDLSLVRKGSFYPPLVKYYEFKLTKPGGRKKSKIHMIDWEAVKEFGGFRPASA